MSSIDVLQFLTDLHGQHRSQITTQDLADLHGPHRSQITDHNSQYKFWQTSTARTDHKTHNKEIHSLQFYLDFRICLQNLGFSIDLESLQLEIHSFTPHQISTTRIVLIFSSNWPTCVSSAV